ncbi:MAG: sulfur carrier protein ThiS [Candidatus Thiodiazotropha sp. (ex Lucinoma borealis)]|nr:sulfur carrier protein ThiS [Candidatus Thiodiazotropha sp. (ex Lucinoma borealis)]MCU7840929.1 sulfur carrier protein ThiS [Candidatus Thiodiazotropha sp. (ex Troendleina suluensis)]MCU7857538.1 sulfur carrier protein ThiS [Candidatus Thiodiazotropha sp. (ex Lucinoma borealis)]MCU7866524.1 sulfur carrier protein ThiS [Candidatus Thiodiazotropha sp. (ex Lucinoma borealis)]MCU7946782.1 sulfur carrier protein ThiS [Candidatus Thiodiazotropha sp. (ex Cardiolucina cf. quadrata)]
MNITLNDTPHHLPDKASLTTLVEQLPPFEPNTVIAVNHRVICNRTWSECELREGDTVVTFQMLGGG